jgi:hypothetical protein
MGSRIEDAFYPPHDVATEVQTFLAENANLFTSASYNSVAVVFSVESNRDLIARQDAADVVHNSRDESVVVPYRVVTSDLAKAAVPFDVVIFPDGLTAVDRVAAEDLDRYEALVLPAVTFLTPGQYAALSRYVQGGGSLVVVGDIGTNLAGADRAALLDADRSVRAPLHAVDAMLPGSKQVHIGAGETCDVAVNIARLRDGSAAVHLVNYAYDEQADRVTPLSDLQVTVTVPVDPVTATLFTPDGKEAKLEVERVGDGLRFRLDTLGVYAVVVLASEPPGDGVS